MHEQVVASDDAMVTIEPNSEALENLPSESFCETELNLENPELNLEEKMGDLALQVVAALQQVHQSGDTFAAIAVNPAIAEAFTTAFRALPDEVISPNIREQLPILLEEKVDPLKIITGTDLEIQFLLGKYGDPQHGGNGLLGRLQEALAREQSPVRVTHDFLRFYYLNELAGQASPKLYTPTGADVIRSLAPNLGKR